MNFAVLGEDRDLPPLARAIALGGEDRITHAAHVGALQAELMSAQPGVRVLSRWEEIPVDGSVDAIIVLGADPVVLEGARKLAAQDFPILLLPRIEQGTQFIYELTLVRDDTSVLLYPGLPLRNDACVARLKQAIASGELGDVLSLQLERELSSTSGAASATLSTDDLQSALLEDCDLLRYLAGDYRRVTAVHTASASGAISFATVTLAGDGLPGATWTAKPGTASSWKLRVIGERGTATLARDVASNHVTLELPDGTRMSSEAAEALALLVSRFKAARGGEAPAHDWTELTRVFETVDATRRSIARRRTIDLFHETQSERSLFKTQMTAIGCGILPLTLLAVIALLIGGSILDPRDAAEADAEALGTIVRVEEFQPGTAALTPAGEAHVSELATRMRRQLMAVLVERTPISEGGGEELDQSRRQTVVDTLFRLGQMNANAQTDLVTLKGKTFGRVMRVARVLVFAPLFIFLALQALVWITKPSAGRGEGA